jgi:long-subunit acyl-CoA synthetase (AMP-forming)
VRRALLGRFAPGDRVAVWANNIPEWVILDLAAGLADITIVTVNPALRPQELAYVLGQSQADGIFLIPAYRESQMGEMVRQVRANLPALREVISFTDWESFCAEAAPDRALPAVNPQAAARSSTPPAQPASPRGPCSTTGGSSTTRGCTRRASASRQVTSSSAPYRCSTPPDA